MAGVSRDSSNHYFFLQEIILSADVPANANSPRATCELGNIQRLCAVTRKLKRKLTIQLRRIGAIKSDLAADDLLGLLRRQCEKNFPSSRIKLDFRAAFFCACGGVNLILKFQLLLILIITDERVPMK